MELYQLLSIITTLGISLISVIAVLFWYIIRSTVSDMQMLKQDLQNHKLDVAGNYAKAADVKSSYDKLYSRLEECLNTINKIATNVAVLTNKVE